MPCKQRLNGACPRSSPSARSAAYCAHSGLIFAYYYSHIFVYIIFVYLYTHIFVYYNLRILVHAELANLRILEGLQRSVHCKQQSSGVCPRRSSSARSAACCAHIHHQICCAIHTYHHQIYYTVRIVYIKKQCAQSTYENPTRGPRARSAACCAQAE